MAQQQGRPQQAQQQQKAPAEPKALTLIKTTFLGREKNLKDMVPEHIDPMRIIKSALAQVARYDWLQKCSIESTWLQVIEAAKLGLEIGGVLGHAYLIPFKNECVLVPGYKGYIKLGRQSGQLKQIEAHCFYEGEAFDYYVDQQGTHLMHRPLRNQGKRGPMLGAYLVAQLADGAHHVEVMDVSEIEAIKSLSPSVASDYSPWNNPTFYPEMAKKTVVRRGFKWLPMSTDLERALELDNHGDPLFEQQINAALPRAKAPPAPASRVEDAEFVDMPISESQAPATAAAVKERVEEPIPPDVDPNTGEEIPPPEEPLDPAKVKGSAEWGQKVLADIEASTSDADLRRAFIERQSGIPKEMESLCSQAYLKKRSALSKAAKAAQT